ncbi:MAG: hypothetical protein AB1631_28495 [Acidobacteriota bacterium]
MKRDDYLWDGSGEVDEEIEQLEKTLASLRFKAQPLKLPVVPRRINLRLFAAAAAVVMALAAGLWIYLSQRHQPAPQIVNQSPSPDQPQTPKSAPDQAIDQSINRDDKQARASKPRRKTVPRNESSETLAIALNSPFEIGKHIESAQLLLRAFKNISEDDHVDVSYERRRSRRLLQQNILLRRSVEARGNLPLVETLGALEPFLLDIANLPERPSRAEMSVIRQRIEKREIIAKLQVFSMVSIVN